MKRKGQGVKGTSPAGAVHYYQAFQGPATVFIRLDDLPAPMELSIRRILLGVTTEQISKATGLSEPQIRKAHANIRQYPYIVDYQEQVSAAYRVWEVQRGFVRTTPANYGGDSGEHPNG